MNEALNHNACGTIVRQAIPYLNDNLRVASFYWTNTVGDVAGSMGLWQITVSRVPEEVRMTA